MWLEERGPGVGGGLPSWLPLWALVRASEVLGPFLRSLGLYRISLCSPWFGHSGWVSSLFGLLANPKSSVPTGGFLSCVDPLTNYTYLLHLLSPSACSGCNCSVSWLAVLPFSQHAPKCLQRLSQPPSFLSLSPLGPPCLPVLPLGKVSPLLLIPPSSWAGPFSLVPSLTPHHRDLSCLTAQPLAWRTCVAHGCFFTCLLATVPDVLAHFHLLQSKKKAASTIGPSPMFGCSSTWEPF